MKLTKKGEYSLKAVLALSASYGLKTMNLREIAEQEKLPYKFLEQIMMTLKKAGVVESTQGKKGGYFLARSPKEITLGEIVRVVDGPLAPLGTAKEIQKSIKSEDRHPGLYDALLDVRNAIADILDKKTLSEISQRSQALREAKKYVPMFSI